jgi:uncharacterized coiled-coil protein SlyX
MTDQSSPIITTTEDISPNTPLNESEQIAYASFNEEDVDDTQNNALAVASLENIIRQRLQVIEKTQEEISELNARLKDMLQNSREFYEADQVAKEAIKKKKQIQNTILSTQEAQQLQSQLEEAKNFQKDNLITLNDMLVEFYETMHIKEIDDANGQPRDLEIKIKITKPKRQK